jgi:mitogen-activated protein kinase 1/3
VYITPDHHQLSIILDVLGTPTLDDFYAISSARSREYIRALPFRKKKPFTQLFPKANPLVRLAIPSCCASLRLLYDMVTYEADASLQALDLVEKLLTFSPKRRITVDEALAHPYLEPYHDPADEPGAAPLDPSFFDFENDLGKEELKRELQLVDVRWRARC